MGRSAGIKGRIDDGSGTNLVAYFQSANAKYQNMHGRPSDGVGWDNGVRTFQTRRTMDPPRHVGLRDIYALGGNGQSSVITSAPPAVRLHTMERLLEQFRRCAGEESVMSYSDFKKAAEIRTEQFALRLFQAIDTDESGYITCEEFVNFMYALECEDLHGRLRILFRLYDIDRSNGLSFMELKNILMESVLESRAQMDRELVEYLAECILETFDTNGSGEISFEEFVAAMSQYPDLVAGLTIVGAGFSAADTKSKGRGVCRSVCGLWCQLWSTIVNNPERTVSLVLLTIILATAFWWRASRYMQGPKFELMGWTLPVAKGCGQMMKVVFALILFPVSRNFMTWLRRTPLKYVIPIDDAIDFHKVLGILGFVFAWIHSICHVVDVHRWGDPARYVVWRKAFPNEETQPTRWEIWMSLVAVTGTFQLIIYTIVFVTVMNWPRRANWMRNTALGKVLNNFNFIWYSHHLVFIFLGLLLFHPVPHIPDEKNEWGYSDVWVWIGVPLIIYVFERTTRHVRQSNRVRLLSAEILPGRVLALKLSKPKNFAYKCGMYVYLNAPAISQFEWHPFSLTSSPGANHLSVHIKVLGDWTEELCERLKKCQNTILPDRNSRLELRQVCGRRGATSGSSMGLWHHAMSRDITNPVFDRVSGSTNPPAPVHRRSNTCTPQIPESDGINRKGYKCILNPMFSPSAGYPTVSPRNGLMQDSMSPSVGVGGSNREGNTSDGQESVSLQMERARSCPLVSKDGIPPPPPILPRPAEVLSEDAVLERSTSTHDTHSVSRKAQLTGYPTSFAVDLSHLRTPKTPAGEHLPIRLMLDGPFGAPAQGYKDHSVLLLVGAGIGVTPFACVLSDLVHRMRQAVLQGRLGLDQGLGLPRLKKVYFYWSVKSQCEVAWFSRVLEAISKDDTCGLLDVNIHITGLRDSKDVRTALLKLVQVSVHVATGVDVMSGLKSKVLTRFGRPDWSAVFGRIQRDHPKETVGVFYSGPNTLASVLRRMSRKHSTRGCKFKFVKESFGYW